MKVCVVGGGSWGTALAKVLAEKGLSVQILVRREEVAECINTKGENPEYLPGVKLPEGITAETLPSQAFAEAEVILWTIPSYALRDFFQRLTPKDLDLLKLVKHHVLGIKGLDLVTNRFPSEVMRENLSAEAKVYVLGGPSFAKEVAKGLPTAVVVAMHGLKNSVKSNDEVQASLRWIQELLAHRYFRVYRNDDALGVECAGALKNVIAIAGGICDGLNLGANARASLITRGLLELIRVGEVLGAKRETFYGLAGLGDLVLTCTSALSRNYRLGSLLAKGLGLEEALREVKEVVEGVKTSKVVKRISEKHNLSLPICVEVYNVIYEGISPETALERLLSRELKDEFC